MTERANKNDDNTPIPVVAVSASAGGLEQISILLRDLPHDTGAAFVILQHLDPKRASHLPELLERTTELPVVEIEDGMPLCADRVHVLPSGCRLSIEGSHLRLTRNQSHEVVPTLIDRFFRDLADAEGERATAIVLSGTGSDGAIGLKAIRAAGGLALAQNPDTAEYEGMPGAAARNLPADCILDTQDMAAKLGNHLRLNLSARPNRTVAPVDPAQLGNPAHTPDDEHNDIQPVDDDTLTSILDLLRSHGQHDFRNHKPNMLKRRIHRRMGLAGIADVADYEQLLGDEPGERAQLRQDFLISVTDFFRELQSYQVLTESALATLLRGRDVEDQIRVWVPGCATGEEAYSIAMLIAEQIDANSHSYDFVVFATDIDDAALDTARTGLYPDSIEADVSTERLRRFFDATDSHYQVKRSLRERVVFAPQSVIDDPPYSRLDLISCRNLLIYLKAETQQRLLALFHFALNPGGFLFLGSSESIGDQIDLFEPVTSEHRLFKRIGTSKQRQIEFPQARGVEPKTVPHRPPPSDADNHGDESEQIARDILLQEHVPAAVLINRKLEILCSYGPSSDYLSLPLGMSSLELMDMVHAPLRSPVRAAVHKALRDHETNSVTTRTGNPEPRGLRITARPLDHPPAARGLILVIFEPTAPVARGAPAEMEASSEVEQQLADELDATRRELNSTIQALESANEDLKGTNEEILSMNEELQSSNEELETSKEELQSLNEELTTVNGELESKVSELESAHNDLSNLFAGTQIATLFLDRTLCIKRFTPAIRDLVNLIASDIGRPLRDMTLHVTDPDLMADIDAVLEDLTPREREVRADAGGWYLRRVLPYRTRDNVIEGVVITFADITELKRAALDSQEHEQRLDLAMSAINGGIWDMPIDPEAPGALPDRIFISARLKQLLGFDDDQMPNSLNAWQERIVPEDRVAFNDIARRQQAAETGGLHYRIRHRDGHQRWFASYGTIVRYPPELVGGGPPARWIGIDCDITASKNIDFEARQRTIQLQVLANAMPVMVIYADRQARIGFTNTAYNDFLDTSAEATAGQDIAVQLTAEDTATIRQCTDTALAGRIVGRELTLTTPGGDQYRVQANFVPHQVDGDTLGFFLVMIDSHQTPLNAVSDNEQQQHLIQLHRLATVGELASTLAHDLSQPLSAINTYASTLTRMLHADKPADETTPLLHKIADQVKRAAAIVSDTRDLVGRKDQGYANLDLNSVVRRVLSLLEGRSRAMNIDIRLHMDSPLPPINGDEVQLEQVLVNIVGNAFDAMIDLERDRRILWITCEKPDSDYLQLVVTDSGDGIAAEKIGSIFESFHTSKLEGMGMGLAISRRIVAAHGGQLWAESEVGDGAAFYIRLPLADSDAAPS